MPDRKPRIEQMARTAARELSGHLGAYQDFKRHRNDRNTLAFYSVPIRGGSAREVTSQLQRGCKTLATTLRKQGQWPWGMLPHEWSCDSATATHQRDGVSVRVIHQFDPQRHLVRYRLDVLAW